jgi:glucose-1-phosphate cytidylyltransferase
MEGTGPVAILCGGRGTRLQEHTRTIPKALVEIGAKPILWHVIRIYASQRLRRFLLLTGYLGEMIEEFVAETRWPEPVEIECLDTGLDTPTGGRLAHARERLVEGPFHATYADGLADIDLEALAAFHRGHGDLATVTVVRPRSQFGVAALDEEDRVLAFDEKPRLDQWVNGGFFFFEPGFLDYVGPDSVLEDAPLRHMAAEGELHAFRHTGFWDCMDTYKDAVVLNDLWRDGRAPWAVWDPKAPADIGAR